MTEENNHKELGDLYPAVLHALRKPHKRIVAAVGGDTDDGRAQAKMISNRLRVAHRMDIDDRLLSIVFEQPSWVGMTKDKGALPVSVMTENVMESYQELRLPFRTCWMEFSGKLFNEEMRKHVWAVGCIHPDIWKIADRDGTPKPDRTNIFAGNMFFDRVGVFAWSNNKSKKDFLCFGSFDGDPAIYMSVLGRAVDAREPNLPSSNVGVKHQSLLLFGVDFEDTDLSEAAPGYVDLVNRCQTPENEALFNREILEHVYEQYAEPWAPQLTRVSWEILRVLNYPWVDKHPASPNSNKGNKSKRPNIAPYDSYYRCTVKLPKEDGIEMRPAPLRVEKYGKRLHVVRGHWRTFKDEFGDVRSRTYIGQHSRGNKALGVVHKDYFLTVDNNQGDDDE